MEEPKLNFERDGNFYIFGDIDESIPENIIAPLVAEIRDQKDKKEPKVITIHISSQGGELYYALDLIHIIEMAKDVGVEIHTVVSSQACSAASMIAISGHRRFARRWSSHLIHFPRVWDHCHNPEMAQRNLDYTKFINKEVVELYKRKTKIKDVEKKMLADNYIIMGNDLLEWGLVDVLV